MHKGFLRIAALTGALAVILGAFAAHGLKKYFSAELLGTFETAVRYQFYHVFALLSAGILYGSMPSKFMAWAGYFFMLGMVLFSGSLYLLCYVKYLDAGLNWIGAITPLGGASFIAGWFMLFLGIRRSR